MELPDSEVTKGIVATILAGFAWIWHRINGDIKANKKAIEMLAASTTKELATKQDIIGVLEQMERNRGETRSTVQTLFSKLDEHAKADTTFMGDIRETLGRLEERSKQRRQGQ